MVGVFDNKQKARDGCIQQIASFTTLHVDDFGLSSADCLACFKTWGFHCLKYSPLDSLNAQFEQSSNNNFLVTCGDICLFGCSNLPVTL